jgi:large subunit ribosomal protein L25
MSTALKASVRPAQGTGSARAARREGKLPGVIYGDNQAPTSVTVDARELSKIIAKGKFFASLMDLELDGKSIQVIPRDVQLDPVRDHPIHVDFQRISATSRLRVKVPTRFINELASPGLKRGGVLNVVRHDVEVTCPANAIPAEFVFDLTGLEIGRSIHISATAMPEGVRPTIIGRDFTVATIAGAVAEEKAADAVPGAEGAAAAPAAGAAAAPAAKGGAAAPAAKAGAAPAKGGAAAKGAAPAAKGAAPAKAPAKK